MFLEVLAVESEEDFYDKEDEPRAGIVLSMGYAFMHVVNLY